MARRRRIPYDPPGNRKRGRRSRLPLGADQIFLSRRMFLAKATVTTAFTVLAGKLGYMQVFQREKFQRDAASNTQQPRYTPAPRGMIYDRAGRELARNKTAFQVRVLPDDLPDEGTPERRRILDALIAELNLPNALVIDHRAIPEEDQDAVYAMVAALRGRTGDQIAKAVEATKESAEINNLVLLEDNLDIDQAARYREEARRLVGLRVMNILEYQIGNAGDGERLVVKTGIPREIALRIEANRLYLPGVEVDGSVLVREYPGGPVMSHLLGYVGVIDEQALENEKNASGNPIYLANDTIGKDGLELAVEGLLRGQRGQRLVIVDAHGTELGPVKGSEQAAREPVPGKSLTLTVDLELQAAASQALRKSIRFSRFDREQRNNTTNKRWPKSGAVVAMDPRNGEVLALVSYPTYDNSLFIDGVSAAKWEELNDPEVGDRPYFNRAIASSQPPGSTLKLFTAAAALHEGKITPESTFYCAGAISVPLDADISKGDKWPCWIDSPGHGDLNVYGAIKKSCDVFFYNVGVPRDRFPGANRDLYYFDYDKKQGKIGEDHEFKGLGIKLIHENLTKRFWFGQETFGDEPELFGEAAGVAPNEAWLEENFGQGWSVGATINTSIGQGYFETTPLQLAVNTVALANGGTIYQPRLVREIHEPASGAGAATASPAAPAEPRAGKTEATEPVELRELGIERGHLDVVREAMLQVVHDGDGSAHAATDIDTNRQVSKWPLTNPEDADDEILIAGKTGTAEVGEQNAEGKYDNQHAWFTCFAPYDDPEIVVTALIELGGEGANYAVPVVDQVLRAYFETTGRRPRGGKTGVLREDKTPIPETEETTKGLPEPGSTVNVVQD